MASNFKFLETEFPVLANFGNLAEQYCYTDPNSCLMKLGMIGETIVNLMFTYDKIPVPYDNSAVNRINALSAEGLLTRDLTDILHALRKVRNKAVHENYSESSDCPVFLQMAYSLSEWFMQTYSDFAPRKRSIAVPRSMSRTKLEVDALALQTYYVQPEIYELGRVADDFSGVKLSIYDRERTICDCFKYRSRLDHEIFSKALNAYAKDEKKNLQNLSIYAKKLRVYKKVNELMSVLLGG